MMARLMVTRSDSRHSAYFGGVSKGLLVLHAERVGEVWQWLPTSGELACPRQRGADLEASLVADGYVVDLRLVGR
jgi:hypothetical protein